MKYASMPGEEDDDLDEESLLESPLDKVEPYSLFKNVLMSEFNINLFLLFSLILERTNIFTTQLYNKSNPAFTRT